MEVENCKLVKCPTCKATDSIFDVSQTLKKKKQRSALVVDKGRPIGIISAVDIIYKVVAEGKTAKSTKARNVMNPVHTIKAEENVVHAYLAMAKKGFMSCPIVKNNKYKGTLYIHEAAKYISALNTKKK